MTRGRAVAGLLLLAVLVGSVLGYYALRPNRETGETIAVDAAVQLSAVSHEPAGGRVDYALVVYNAGGTPVRVQHVAIRGNGLTVRDHDNARPLLIAVGASSLISLSVQLDCRRHSAVSGPTAGLVRSRLTLRPDGGRVRRISLPVEASSLTDVADTFCSVAPGRRTALSGPILLPQADVHRG
jgi:hypothetical protein